MEKRPTVEQAAAMAAQGLEPLPPESVPLTDAHGRFLASGVASGQEQPPFPLAAHTGYAVRSSNLTRARSGRPVTLRVVDSLRAGQEALIPVNDAQAVRVAAGAMLPAGCDAVVRLEDTDGGLQQVQVRRELWPFENFIRQGSDTGPDQLLLPAGARLTPAAVGLLATLGFPQVSVCRRPRAAVLSLGDGLIQPGAARRGGQLYASLPYFLRARLLALGAEVPIFSFSSARPEPLAQTLADCLSKSDLILTVGGLTGAEGHVLAHALSLMEAEPVFFQVQMEDGDGILFSRTGGKPILSLPSAVGPTSLLAELFLPPILAALTGCTALLPSWQTAGLELSYPKASPKRRFLWARRSGGRITDLPPQPFTAPTQGANCLLEIPAGSSPLLPGERLRVLVLS